MYISLRSCPLLPARVRAQAAVVTPPCHSPRTQDHDLSSSRRPIIYLPWTPRARKLWQMFLILRQVLNNAYKHEYIWALPYSYKLRNKVIDEVIRRRQIPLLHTNTTIPPPLDTYRMSNDVGEQMGEPSKTHDVTVQVSAAPKWSEVDLNSMMHN